MFDRPTSPAQDREAGFTLIELLVVIIIIGILAATAIPTFLGQRERSYDSAAQSDLRNLAIFEETRLAGGVEYASFAELGADALAVTPSKRVTLTITKVGASGYCLSARHAGSSTTWYYDSQAGGIQVKGSTGCPVTTSGVDGGSLTG